MNRLLEEKGGRVLAFGAHPDDLEVGAGGLLARLSEEGAEVTLAIVSVPNNIEQRKAEARAAAELIDANVVFIYDEKPSRVEDIPMHELVRRFDQVVGDVFQAHGLQGNPGPRTHLGAGEPQSLQDHFDVLGGGQHRHQGVPLQDDAEPGRDLAARQGAQTLAVDQDLAGVRVLQAGEQGQQARLAAA